MNETHHTQAALANFEPRHDTFVGVDSDGCVFDTMEIKQKECFHGLMASQWGLTAIEPLLRETAEFVNLYSKSRGRNRFLCLIETMDRLRARPEAVAAGLPIPAFPDLKAFVAEGHALGHPALESAIAEKGSQELADVLAWSLKVNQAIQDTVKNIPPFPWARESLEALAGSSDVICVSQTPLEALIREWNENELTSTVRMIAGQELGTKSEHLSLATRGRYAPNQVLMIGDAPGDHAAAKDTDALFYPIIPSHEAESWERFFKEAYAKFLNGTYAGAYEQGLIAAFDAALPETPPWEC